MSEDIPHTHVLYVFFEVGGNTDCADLRGQKHVLDALVEDHQRGGEQLRQAAVVWAYEGWTAEEQATVQPRIYAVVLVPFDDQHQVVWW